MLCSDMTYLHSHQSTWRDRTRVRAALITGSPEGVRPSAALLVQKMLEHRRSLDPGLQ